MSYKLQKTIQQEAGPFDGVSNNIMTINLDEVGQMNMGLSYLDFEVNFFNPANQVAGIQITNSTQVHFGDFKANRQYTPSVMIDNVRLESDNKGLIEESLHRNVITQNLEPYTHSSEVERSKNPTGAGEAIRIDDTGLAHILIPLREVLSCGALMWDNNKMGNSRLRLEFQNPSLANYLYLEDEFAVRGTFPCEDVDAPAAEEDLTQITLSQPWVSLKDFERVFMCGKPMTFAGTQDGDPVLAIFAVPTSYSYTLPANEGDPYTDLTLYFSTPLVANNDAAITAITLTRADGVTLNNNGQFAVGAGNQITQVVITNGATALPLYLAAAANGKKINVVFDSDTTGAASVMSVIECNLAGAQAQGNDLQLTFDPPIYTNNGVAEVAVRVGLMTTVDTLASINVSLSVLRCQLVQAKPLQKVSVPPLVFRHFTLEQLNMNAVSDFRKQYELESTCDLFVFLTPLPNQIVSSLDNLSQYRLSLNSIDATNRDIVIDSSDNSLHYDRLVIALDNIRSLQDTPFVIVERIPPPAVEGMNNVIQVRLNATANQNFTAKLAYAYKRVVRQVN